MHTPEIKVLAEDESLIPFYASEEAAGADIRAFLKEEVTLLPGESRLIPTSLKMQIPKGFEIQVRPRSGLALKHGVTVLNTPGTVDSDYRGELCVILINHGKNPFIVTHGMRIAQLVVAPVLRANFVKQTEDQLGATLRGERGFGHSGTH